MGMQAFHCCAICGRALESTSNEAYLLAQANRVGSSAGDGESRVSFDSSRKILICKECIFDSVVAKKYSHVKIPAGVAAYLRFYVRDGNTYLGMRPDRVLKEDCTQQDVDDLVIEVTKLLLKGK